MYTSDNHNRPLINNNPYMQYGTNPLYQRKLDRKESDIMTKQLKKHLLYNIIGSAFLALFGAVYEIFSHGVYSYFMIYAFAIPLVMGVLPYAILLLKDKSPDNRFLKLWNTAIAVLSTGSVFAGVLAIYGTTNSLIIVYPIVGGILMLLSFASLFIKKQPRRVSDRMNRYDSAV